jgi:hypothetical protein
VEKQCKNKRLLKMIIYTGISMLKVLSKRRFSWRIPQKLNMHTGTSFNSSSQIFMCMRRITTRDHLLHQEELTKEIVA